MNAEQRKTAIRKTILESLQDCGGYLLPDTTLVSYVQMAIPGLVLSEYDTELRWLEREKLILGVRPGLGGPVKWKITDAGRAMLAEATS